MIILEGPDGSGKTTLARQLSEALNIPIMPRVVSKDTEAMVSLRKWVDDNLDGGLVPAIFDRHRLISEPIYGPIMRDKPQPGFGVLDWLAPRMDRFYQLQPLIIYCLPPLQEVEENLARDPDNTAVVKHTSKIYQAYVSRISLDLKFAPRRPLVWNYKKTPTVHGLPNWMPKVDKFLLELNK